MQNLDDNTQAQPAPPCIMVIFGAGGDLTRRKLIPSLYHLMREGLLADGFAVVGVDRLELSDEAFRELFEQTLRDYQAAEFDPEVWRRLAERLHYSQGDFKDPAAYQALRQRLQHCTQAHASTANYLFYMATPPSLFSQIIRLLAEAELTRQEDNGWRRVIIEKPFGKDLDSAIALNRELHQYLNEAQIFRIDHYLGKETVQNIMAFRFANGFTEPTWSHQFIEHVQITVAESVGVEHRGTYYEEAGALRDMIPNHLLVLLGFVAMEPPNSFDACNVRDEVNKVLRAVQPLSPEDVLTRAVRGQYGEGLMPNGEKVAGYRGSPGVDTQSRTETYAAIRFMIDNWRWADVPFYLRTGKRLAGQFTEIVIQYRHVPFQLFRNTPVEQVQANQLVIRVQPDEGIQLSFSAKIPGPVMRLGRVNMDFCYADYFGNAPTTGYETLIYDAMNGDATLFKHADTVEVGWELVAPVLDVWSALPPRDFPNYRAGSWGPAAAGELPRRDGFRWRHIG
jgi:glucose-6-phosphate 1-dehydrogenase